MNTMTLVPWSTCPCCGSRFDAATATAPGERPEPGDCTLCFECGDLLKFGDDMQLVRLTSEERIAAEQRPDVARVQAAWRMIHKRKGS